MASPPALWRPLMEEKLMTALCRRAIIAGSAPWIRVMAAHRLRSSTLRQVSRSALCSDLGQGIAGPPQQEHIIALGRQAQRDGATYAFAGAAHPRGFHHSNSPFMLSSRTCPGPIAPLQCDGVPRPADATSPMRPRLAPSARCARGALPVDRNGELNHGQAKALRRLGLTRVAFSVVHRGSGD